MSYCNPLVKITYVGQYYIERILMAFVLDEAAPVSTMGWAG
jgi:hypothetical protein